MIVEIKQRENGELFLEIPDSMLTELGWNSGDTLRWVDNKNGSWSIERVEDDLKYFVVDVLSSFRNRFVVKAKSLQHAFDEVTCRADDCEFVEFSQKHIGCEIIDGTEVSKDELLALHKKDNDYLASWPDDVVFEKLTNTINYEE